MNTFNKATSILSTICFSAGSIHAATVLVDNDFEDGTIQDWTVINGSDAGLYQNGEIKSNMGAPDALIDYAPGGEYSLWEGRGGSQLVLSSPLLLDTQGYTQIQIGFDFTFRNPTGTRRLYTAYSSNGGSSWTDLGFRTGESGSQTYTLNEGAPHTFTDNALFRFSFGDSGGAAGPAFIDNILISGTPDFVAPSVIPEPSTALLGVLGGLLLLRRRK